MHPRGALVVVSIYSRDVHQYARTSPTRHVKYKIVSFILIGHNVSTRLEIVTSPLPSALSSTPAVHASSTTSAPVVGSDVSDGSNGDDAGVTGRSMTKF